MSLGLEKKVQIIVGRAEVLSISHPALAVEQELIETCGCNSAGNRDDSISWVPMCPNAQPHTKLTDA